MAINDRNFVDNDPSPENRCGADFLNAVKDELNNVIRRAGWELDFDNPAQVAAAIYEMINTTAKASTSTQFLRGTIAELTNQNINGNGGLYIDDTNQIFIIYPAPQKSGNISDIQLAGSVGAVKIGGVQHSLHQYFAGKEQADRAEKAIAEAGEIYGDFAAIEEARNTAETAKRDAVTAKEAAEAAETNASKSQSAASSSKTAAATSESNAANSAIAAAASASAANTSETNAAGSASAASSSASAASTSESNASASATDANTAKTAAETARSAAEALYGNLSAVDTAKTAAQAAQTAAEKAKTDAENLYGDLAAVEEAKTAAEAARDTVDGFLISHSANLIGTQAVVLREFNVTREVTQ